MNMFLVLNVLGLSPSPASASASPLQVILFDRFSDGPFIELIKKTFSPDRDVLRHHHFNNKRVSS